MTTRKPSWIRASIPGGPSYVRIKKIIEDGALQTVCQEAGCPNRGECFERGTATFLLLGPRCSRRCRYCAVEQGIPAPPDAQEPRRVAAAVAAMGLTHAVITSVTRDDLHDGGASFFTEAIVEIRHAAPRCSVEVLVPDFGSAMERGIDLITAASPNVINHNIETVRCLFSELRPSGDYDRSLELIARAAQSGIAVKSGLMLGLGETADDVVETLNDLKSTGCARVTVGQYCQSTRTGFPVARYYTPEEFDAIAAHARDLGFDEILCGPMVRSSYRAGDLHHG